jgi:syntaxin 16
LGLSALELQEIEDTEALAQQRDAEITKIAASIEELAAIFKELAVLVIDQGTVLDRIDYNIEQTLVHAEEGVSQLVKADESQKSSRSIKCIFCLLAAIAVCIIILYIKWRVI